MIVVAVPGLQWSDLSHMPTLQRLAASGAVGQLSVKTGGSTTRCLAGVLAFSAGNRTVADSSACAVSAAAYRQAITNNQHSRYAAQVGALSQALAAHGIANYGGGRRLCGPLPSPLPRGGPTSRHSVACVLDGGLYRATGAGRLAADAATDRDIERIVTTFGVAQPLIVAGISDQATGPSHLHPLVITGPGWSHHELTSASTGRTPYVQLIDLAPTVLSMLHVPVPTTMVGQPAHLTASPARSIASYVDADRHARAAPSVAFLGTISWVTVVLLLLLVAGAARRRWAVLLARLLAPAPVVSYLVNALPWWRWNHAVFGLLVLTGVGIVAAVQTVIARTRHRWVPVALVLTAVVLAVDQLTGSHLQTAAPLGDSPISAGRFTGMGNLDFAAFVTAVLLLAGLACRWPLRRAIVGSGLLCVVAIAVDGLPRWGDDLGGVVSTVPAALLLVALVARIRLTVWRVAGVVVGGAAAAVALTLADYARPPQHQTHVGRFVGQVLHGGAGTEVHRKFDSAVHTVGLDASTALVVVAIVVAVLRRDELRGWLAERTMWRPGAVAAVVVAVLGSALNDSGIEVAGMCLTVGLAGLLATQSGLAGGRTPLPAPPANPAIAA